MPVVQYLSALRFTGADAGDFLQNQLSADVMALAEGESTYACYCEPKGRVLALMLVCRIENDFLVILSSELAGPMADRMKIYVMRSKVEIEVLGDCAVVVNESTAAASEKSSFATVAIPGTKNCFTLLQHEHAGERDEAAADAWKASELQRGIAWLGAASSGEFIPQWLGFDQVGAVNFRKGCYPGQEIVARTHYLGKVKRLPRVLLIEPSSCPASLEKVQLVSAGQSHDANVVDCVHTPGQTCLFVVTRLPAESEVERVLHQDQAFDLL